MTKGYFSLGKVSNFGIIESFDQSYHYRGALELGNYHGLGQEKIRDSEYHGYFSRGARHGVGIFKAKDGTRFMGNWVAGD